MYDIIVIGGGPAGLTAGAQAALRGLKTIILEKQDKLGGQPVLLYGDKVIHDHPGFPVGILGREFGRMLHLQAINSKSEVTCDTEVIEIQNVDDHLEIETVSKVYEAKRAIVCTGMLNIPRRPKVLEGYKGKGLSFKVSKVDKFQDKDVVVIGGGNHAFDSALQVAEVAKSVTILVKRDQARALTHTVEEAENKVKVLYETHLTNTMRDENLGLITGVQVETKGKREAIPCDEIICAIGFTTVDTFFKSNGIETNDDGTVKVDRRFATNKKNVFAAGDICGDPKLIAVACSRGIIAAINAFASIKKPYWI